MSDPTRREILTLMLPHGSLGRDGPGGSPTLTSHDVAGALAWGNLRPRAQLVARAVILRDFTAYGELLAEAVAEAERLVPGHESERRSDRVFAIAARAVLELVSDTRCLTCQGRGWATATQPCRGCGQTGRGRPLVRCDACEGAGTVAEVADACEACDGHGERVSAHGGVVQCFRCRGSGEGRHRGARTKCSACHGRRVVRLRDRRVAELVGISHSAWSRFWAPRVRELVARLEADLEVAERHVRRRIRDSELAPA